MKKLFEEFKAFIAKGNVLGLAIGIIIGNSFNAIVNSLINDVIMPVIGKLCSGIAFDSWFIPLDGNVYESYAAAKAASAPMITIGNFISAVINFFIVALVLFFIMKAVAKVSLLNKKKEEEKPKEAPVVSDEVKLLTEIRDMMKEQTAK